MKYFLLFIIKSYWLIIPKSKRRKCIFKQSCSNYVYQTATKDGFIAGLYAFKYRYKNCRYGYETFINPIDQKVQIKLRNNEILDQEDISERFLL
ncbi:Putative membrane protein insertion efficiency factor [Kordia antarctica]|uniref:Membrane protein insertion efficiency factor n=1 Tax=Kordia antarctica TaxID=1218801 RepID=A0A7L4ZK15_9FLAO|nr:membrane protein insertion efficiency factor YidD [Kordia antarctica]QHI37053.1 Putative membrane protein insertion efficiency factor [Kordia antarctica]